MSQLGLTEIHDAAPADSAWKGVCLIGGVAVLIQVACVLITMTVVFTLGGEPGTPDEYFTQLQSNRLMGLLRLDFPTIISMALYYLTFFGLYGALKRADGAYAALATALAFVGLTLWLATHSAFSMIHLGDRYAAAATDAQRSQLLAAGEAIIASDMWHSTGALIGGIFVQSAAVMISVLMLRSNIFSNATAYVGILGNGLDLMHIIINIIVPGNPANILMAVAGPLYLIWFILIGRRLLQLGRL